MATGKKNDDRESELEATIEKIRQEGHDLWRLSVGKNESCYHRYLGKVVVSAELFVMSCAHCR